MTEIADRRAGRYLKREADRLVLTAYLRSDENRATPWKDVIEPFYDTMRAAKLEHLLRSRDLARRNAQAA